MNYFFGLKIVWLVGRDSCSIQVEPEQLHRRHGSDFKQHESLDSNSGDRYLFCTAYLSRLFTFPWQCIQVEHIYACYRSTDAQCSVKAMRFQLSIYISCCLLFCEKKNVFNEKSLRLLSFFITHQEKVSYITLTLCSFPRAQWKPLHKRDSIHPVGEHVRNHHHQGSIRTASSATWQPWKPLHASRLYSWLMIIQ